jgi:hypothetical protein
MAEAIAGRDVEALTALRKGLEQRAAALESTLADELDRAVTPPDARMNLRELKFLSKVVADISGAIAEIDD